MAAVGRLGSLASPSPLGRLVSRLTRMVACISTLPSTGSLLSAAYTPSLLVSLPSLEANDRTMRERIAPSGVKLRPHAKAFKSSALARWLLARAGDETVGLCVQTVHEAEAMLSRGGVANLLLTNELYGPNARRLAELAAAHPTATVGVLVDSVRGVQALSDASVKAGAALAAYVEVDAGQNRCGVRRESEEVARVAREVRDAPALELGGLQVYHGGIQHVRSSASRRAAVEAGPARAARRAVELLHAEGLAPPVLTGGGTGTFMLDLSAGVLTEVQPGSYLFMDGDYGQNEDRLFEQSLFVHTTVISVDEATGKRVVDAGAKAMDLLCGAPTVARHHLGLGSTSTLDNLSEEIIANITYKNGGDEHGILGNVPPGALPAGSTLQLVPSHCDACVNLHSHLLGVRNGVVETIFPLDARGFY